MNLNTNKFFNSTEVHISSRMNEYLKKNFGYEVEGDFDKLHEAKKVLEAEKVELKKLGYMNKQYVENMLMIETITSLLKAHSKDTTSSHEQQEVTEETAEFSDKQIKMAFGVLNDPRYKDGNYSGAVATIEKIAKGLSKHPSVANALKRANESVVEETLKELDMDLSQTEGYDTGNTRPRDSMGKRLPFNQYPKPKVKIPTPSMDYVGSQTEQVAEDDEEKGPDHYRWKNDSQLSIAKDRLEASIQQLEHAIQYRAENSHLMMRGGDKAGTGDLYKMKEQLEKLHDSWDEQTEYYGM